MIRIKARTIWQGKVGINDKYVTQALKEKKGLSITCDGATMDIPANRVQKDIVAKSDKPFIDKFKNRFYWLVYYDWKPQTNQRKLL